ncbi:MAG: hypothetical protein KF911_06850 [Pseudomonadales bacterium]|nr:hypothetical protein [Pseudomonadales bacterium]
MHVPPVAWALMGYRALLKNYLRHVIRVTGSHHIDAAESGGPLSKRDLAELRLLAAEVERETYRRRRAGPSEQALDAPPEHGG